MLASTVLNISQSLIIDSTELLVTQDSSIIHNNIYTSKLFQSRLYDLVSIYNRIIVCYSLAICQEQNRPYCKAAITTMNHILERETGQTMCIHHIIVVLHITTVAVETHQHCSSARLTSEEQGSITLSIAAVPELFCGSLGFHKY